jgi:HEAT repeat protein
LITFAAVVPVACRPGGSDPGATGRATAVTPAASAKASELAEQIRRDAMREIPQNNANPITYHFARRIAEPLRALLKLGNAAREPIDGLLSDPDVYVRRNVAYLLAGHSLSLIEQDARAQMMPNVVVPLLTKCLQSEDPEMRSQGCNGLSNHRDVADLALLKDWVSKLHALKDDPNRDVRSIAWHSSQFILRDIENSAGKVSDREWAAIELNRLLDDKNWGDATARTSE